MSARSQIAETVGLTWTNASTSSMGMAGGLMLGAAAMGTAVAERRNYV